jgi:hypothetical protein
VINRLRRSDAIAAMPICETQRLGSFLIPSCVDVDVSRHCVFVPFDVWVCFKVELRCCMTLLCVALFIKLS